MSTTNENREYFLKALQEAIESKMKEEEEAIKNSGFASETTNRHKRRMNRILRERVGSSRIPHPEVDNLYERVRSKIVVKLHINDFLDRRKEHKKEKRRKRFLKK